MVADNDPDGVCEPYNDHKVLARVAWDRRTDAGMIVEEEANSLPEGVMSNKV